MGLYDYDFDVWNQGISVYDETTKVGYDTYTMWLTAEQALTFVNRLIDSPYNGYRLSLWSALQGRHCVGFVADTLGLKLPHPWACPDALIDLVSTTVPGEKFTRIL